MGDRIILHSDLNGFFASVEMMLDPRLSGRAVAVSGSTEERHGIVLAKSEKAKRAGIKTGMVNFEALRLCPELIFVKPHYDQYAKYSKLAREIYERYTDLVEPYGMDECFLDVTGSGIFGTGEEIANKIRKNMKEELGLTVSVGVSFNKVFAKLGSDMKKPDAVTVISRENFRRRVFPQPVGNLIYCGSSTAKKLCASRIFTIGDLAESDRDFIRTLLGKNGEELWLYANGLDEGRVRPAGVIDAPKSIGHGVTCTEDLKDNEEVKKVILCLSEEVAHRLKKHGTKAGGIQLMIRDNALKRKNLQTRLDIPLMNPLDISEKAMELFLKNYDWGRKIRSLSVTAINLIPEDAETQLSFFSDMESVEKRDKAFLAVDEIRERFGKELIKTAAIYESELSGGLKLPGRKYESVLPGQMYK